jgi:hypothetical protein
MLPKLSHNTVDFAVIAVAVKRRLGVEDDVQRRVLGQLEREVLPATHNCKLKHQ